eukprot:scaffold2654_cov126-Cylindrotheca_fusiformis.AAC.6
MGDTSKSKKASDAAVAAEVAIVAAAAAIAVADTSLQSVVRARGDPSIDWYRLQFLRINKVDLDFMVGQGLDVVGMYGVAVPNSASKAYVFVQYARLESAIHSDQSNPSMKSE